MNTNQVIVLQNILFLCKVIKFRKNKYFLRFEASIRFEYVKDSISHSMGQCMCVYACHNVCMDTRACV